MRSSNYTFTGLPPVLTFDSDATLVSVYISSFTFTPTRTFTPNAGLVSASASPSATSIPDNRKARYVGISVLVMALMAAIVGIMICLCRTRRPRPSPPSATEDCSDIALVDLESQRLPSFRFSSTRLRGIPHLPDSPTRGSMPSLHQSSSSLSHQLARALAEIQDGPLVSPGRAVPQGGRPLPTSNYVQRSRALRSNPVSPREVRAALNGPRPIPSAQVSNGPTLAMPTAHRPIPSLDRIHSWITDISAQSRPLSHHDEPRALTEPPPVSRDKSSVSEFDDPPPVPAHREYPLPKPSPRSPRQSLTGESSDFLPVPLQRELTVESNSPPPVPPHREFRHEPSSLLTTPHPAHNPAKDNVGEVSPVSSPSKTAPKLYEVSPESTPRTPRLYRSPYVTDGSSDSPPSPSSPLLLPSADVFDNVPLDTPSPTKAKRVSFEDGSRPGDEL